MHITAAFADATVHDLPGRYRVCRLTGDRGRDASRQDADPDLLGHVWAGPYAVSPEAVALVVRDEAGVAGHGVGAPDGRHLGVDPAHAAAIAFFERLGFHAVPQNADAVTYAAALGPRGLVAPGGPDSTASR